MSNRFVHALQGCAIGDAFGGGVEFKSREWMIENVHFDKYFNVRNYGENNLHPGEFTDDTEHTIAVVQTLLENHTFDNFGDKMLQNMLKVYNDYKKQKGYARTGHGSIESWYKGTKTMEQVRNDQAIRDDPGNAPVMRCLPFALLNQPIENIMKYSQINADSTHGPHPYSTISSLLTIMAARHFLVNNGNGSTLIPELVKFFSKQDASSNWIVDKLKQVDQLPNNFYKLTKEQFEVILGPQPVPLSKYMFVENLYGLPCSGLMSALTVVYVLKNASTPFEALKWSIHIGGDVDSLAAVTVGTLAGVYGLGSIPAFMREQTEGMDLLADLGNKLYEHEHSG